MWFVSFTQTKTIQQTHTMSQDENNKINGIKVVFNVEKGVILCTWYINKMKTLIPGCNTVEIGLKMFSNGFANKTDRKRKKIWQNVVEVKTMSAKNKKTTVFICYNNAVSRTYKISRIWFVLDLNKHSIHKLLVNQQLFIILYTFSLFFVRRSVSKIVFTHSIDKKNINFLVYL